MFLSKNTVCYLRKLGNAKVERRLKPLMLVFCYIVTITILFDGSVLCAFAKLGVSFAVTVGIIVVFIGTRWLAGGWQAWSLI